MSPANHTMRLKTRRIAESGVGGKAESSSSHTDLLRTRNACPMECTETSNFQPHNGHRHVRAPLFSSILRLCVRGGLFARRFLLHSGCGKWQMWCHSAVSQRRRGLVLTSLEPNNDELAPTRCCLRYAKILINHIRRLGQGRDPLIDAGIDRPPQGLIDVITCGWSQSALCSGPSRDPIHLLSKFLGLVT